MKTLTRWFMLVALVATMVGCRDWFPPTDPKDPDPPAHDLTGTRWCLTLIASPNAAPIRIDPALGMYAEFAVDGNVSGFGGCNGFGGVYRTSGKMLSIADLVGTEMWCDDKSRYEGLFTQALLASTSYMIDGSTLTIYYGGRDGQNAGGSLQFNACAKQDPPLAQLHLSGTKWCFTGWADGTTGAADMWVEFTNLSARPTGEAGGVRGFGGCNTFNADYMAGQLTAEGASADLSITNLVSTKIACNTIGSTESRFFAALLAAKSCSITNGQLTVVYTLPAGTIGKMIFKSCSNPGDPTDPTDPSTGVVYGRLGEKMDIPYNGTAVIGSEGIKMHFSNITDNRCPVGVQCIVAGNAAVTLDAGVSTMNAVWKLVLNQPDMPHDGMFGQYKVELLGVNPYPDANRPQIPIKEYVATVIVTRL